MCNCLYVTNGLCPTVTSPARPTALQTPLHWPDTHIHTLFNTAQISCLQLHLSPPRPRYASYQGGYLSPSSLRPICCFGPRRCHASPPLPVWNSALDAPSHPQLPPPLSHSVHSYRQREIMTNGLVFIAVFIPISQFVLLVEKNNKKKKKKRLKLSIFGDDSTQWRVLWFDL